MEDNFQGGASLTSFAEDSFVIGDGYDPSDPWHPPVAAPEAVTADCTNAKTSRSVGLDETSSDHPPWQNHSRFRREFLDLDPNSQLQSNRNGEIEITFVDALVPNGDDNEGKQAKKLKGSRHRRFRRDFREADLDSELNRSIIFEDESGVLVSSKESELDGNVEGKQERKPRRSRRRRRGDWEANLDSQLQVDRPNDDETGVRRSKERDPDGSKERKSPSSLHRVSSSQSIGSSRDRSREQLFGLREKLRQKREREAPPQVELQFQHHQSPRLQPPRMGDFLDTSSALLGPLRPPPVATKTSRDDWELDVSSRSIKSSGWLRKFRIRCGTIVELPWVQLWVVYLIVLNGLTLGIATFDFVSDNPGVDRAFDVMDRVFLSIFTLEIFLQLIYRGISLFQDGWLTFDFVVVALSWSLESFRIIRAFRIFRIFRLVTRIGQMRELIMAIGAVLPNLYAIFMMLLLVFYIFAVLFTHLFGDVVVDLGDGETIRYFSDLGSSLFTCMELMTLEWVGIVRPVMAQQWWAWIPFSLFLTITGFISFNLIVAVVCDAVRVVDIQIKEEYEEKERLRQGLGPEDDESEVNLPEQLKRAKQRINELSKQVRSMKSQHFALNEAVARLLEEQEVVVPQHHRDRAKLSPHAKDETTLRRTEEALTQSPEARADIKRRSSI